MLLAAMISIAVRVCCCWSDLDGWRLRLVFCILRNWCLVRLRWASPRCDSSTCSHHRVLPIWNHEVAFRSKKSARPIIYCSGATCTTCCQIIILILVAAPELRQYWATWNIKSRCKATARWLVSIAHTLTFFNSLSIVIKSIKCSR